MAKKDYQSLVRIEKHPGFWRNPESQKIIWRGTIRGRSIKKSTETTKISEAKQKIDEFLLSLTVDNLDRATRERRGIVNPPLKSLWDEMMRTKGNDRQLGTIDGYETQWRLRIGVYAKDHHLKDISSFWLSEFERWFLENCEGRTYFNTRKCLQMFLNYLHHEGYVNKKYKTRDLDKFISTKFKKKAPGRLYSDEELDLLISKMPSNFGATALTVLIATGARKNEILSRKWQDFDEKKGILSIWSDKNKKWRTVPLTERAIEALERLKAESGGGSCIFPMKTDPNRPISSQLFDKEWVIAKKSAKIQGRARVHDIRHTVATKTARDGWPIPIASVFLDMTVKIYMKVYVHIDPNDVSKWVKISFERGLT